MHTASFAGVQDAARQIAGHAVRTPLIESPALNAQVGGRVLLKHEVTVEIEGADKPALVAEWLGMQVVG